MTGQLYKGISRPTPLATVPAPASIEDSKWSDNNIRRILTALCVHRAEYQAKHPGFRSTNSPQPQAVLEKVVEEISTPSCTYSIAHLRPRLNEQRHIWRLLQTARDPSSVPECTEIWPVSGAFKWSGAQIQQQRARLGCKNLSLGSITRVLEYGYQFEPEMRRLDKIMLRGSAPRSHQRTPVTQSHPRAHISAQNHSSLLSHSPEPITPGLSASDLSSYEGTSIFSEIDDTSISDTTSNGQLGHFRSVGEKTTDTCSVVTWMSRSQIDIETQLYICRNNYTPVIAELIHSAPQRANSVLKELGRRAIEEEEDRIFARRQRRRL